MAQCAECTYLDLEDKDSSGKFWCDKQLERHLAFDPECWRFCKAYNREYCSIKNAIDYSKNHSSSEGCYLTTMLCSILKLNDNNLYLNTFRKFRQNVLQKDEKYKKILIEYDIIGPKIAEALYNDPLKEKIATIYFNKYIVSIFYFIINKNNEEAINLYIEMTNNLKNLYGLNNYNLTIEKINNADIEKSGHGKYIQKKITLQ